MRTGLFAALLLLSACRADSPPNIIYILADDLGYGELGSYGQQIIQTPNLDRLAADGMRFTQHYSGSPVCAPSRGALLTGKHTGHGYVRDNYEMGGWGPDEPEGQLPLPGSEVTIAELLKPLGYSTGFIGKWGLGGPDSEGHPNRQGFDHFYGYLCQRVAHNYYPTHLWRNSEMDPLPGNAPWFSAHQRIDAALESDAEYTDRYAGTRYAPDHMLAEAEQFVRANGDRPFFLVFATPVPHLALQVPDESLEPYADLDTAAYLGNRGYLPHPNPRAAYAGMISRMDRDIGHLLAVVDEMGLSHQTVVVFSSDNGPTYTGGVEAEFFNSSGPLRGLKGSVYEGGVRVPMIVRWPGHVPAGSVSERISAFWDVLPTVAELVGVAAPAGIDGSSFLPSLLGHDQATAAPLYWEYHAFGGMQAVRMGRWKGVRLQAREHPNGPIALYDLSTDIGETSDLAAELPGVVARIDSIMSGRTRSEVGRWNFGADYEADRMPVILP